MIVHTVGFTKKPAETFFTLLRDSGARRLVDVRLNNISQLAGFAKRQDLEFFLREICRMDYRHRPILAPTQELLDSYRKAGGGWPAYEEAFRGLMRERQIEQVVSKDEIDGSVLLCSEDQPQQCHRRIVAEYLRDAWGDLEIVHLR
jgi:uncharacterized protein (DUF488 family)